MYLNRRVGIMRVILLRMQGRIIGFDLISFGWMPGPSNLIRRMVWKSYFRDLIRRSFLSMKQVFAAFVQNISKLSHHFYTIFVQFLSQGIFALLSETHFK